MKTTLIILAILIGLVIVWDGTRTVYFLRKTGELMRSAVPYSRVKSVSSKPGSPMRILVLGDSTAVGTGAKSNLNSTAGRLGSTYPDAEIVNISQNGLKVAGLLDKMNQIGKDEYFDLIVVQIGANDIIRLTPKEKIESGIGEVLKRTEQMGSIVIVMHSGDIGDAKFFPWYIKPIMSKRSREVRDIYKKQSEIYHANYVDLIGSSLTEKFKQNPNQYYAADFIHLNDEGYGLWFDEIKKKLI